MIDNWVKPSLHRPGEMVLADSGVPVWAIIGYARGVDYEVEEVARAYRLPGDAVRAALAYYHRHPLQIDARLEANAAWHTG